MDGKRQGKGKGERERRKRAGVKNLSG